MRSTLRSGSREVIELHDVAAVRHFTRVLGCTREQLSAAIAAVGPRFANVRMRFRRRPLVRHHRRPHPHEP